MVNAILNLAVGVLALAAIIVWIISLVKWDGKIHCDKSKCEDCIYYPNCEHAKEEETE